MDTERRALCAALLLGAGLLAVGLPASPGARLACEEPFELAADTRAGFSTLVGCGAEANASDSPRRSLRGPARLLFGLRLDLNDASQAALEALPSIGPARAAAIVRARTGQRFASVADLERVPGIGRKTRLGVQPWATVAGSLDADRESPWTVR